VHNRTIATKERDVTIAYTGVSQTISAQKVVSDKDVQKLFKSLQKRFDCPPQSN
jgi:hypothetical protein